MNASGSEAQKSMDVILSNLGGSKTGPLTMSSREIADLTGKEHKHVLTDIRKMLEELGKTSAEFSADRLDFEDFGRADAVWPRA